MSEAELTAAFTQADQAEIIDTTQPSFWLIDEPTQLYMEFGRIGHRFMNDARLTVQPGTERVVTLSDGNRAVQFQAYHRMHSGISDKRLMYTEINKFRRLIDLAERIKNGVSINRVVFRSQTEGDLDGFLESAVVGGTITPLDDDVVNKAFSRDAMAYQVQIIVRPWAERRWATNTYTVGSDGSNGISLHGGSIFLKDWITDRGTTGARVTRMKLNPRNDANYQFRNIFIGIKAHTWPHETTNAQVQNQIKISGDSVQPYGSFGYDNLTNQSELIDGDGVSLIYKYPTSSWGKKFHIPYFNWNSDMYLNYKQMHGAYRLVGRIKMTDPGEDSSLTWEPRWGVRARVVHDADNEAQRLPDLILPDPRIGEGYNPAYYELGDLTVGGRNYMVNFETTISSFGIALDSVIYSIGSDESDDVAGRTGSRVPNVDLVIDDMFLMPLDSYIRIRLPRQIESYESLFITIDDYDKPHVFVVYGGQTTGPSTIAMEVTNVETGPNGFTIPPWSGSKMVFLADSGPDGYFSTSARLKSVELEIKHREQGGIL